MLRNIDWNEAETLLATPGAFELMAYLDGNDKAIGPRASAKYKNQKEDIEKNLYKLNQVNNDIKTTFAEITDEMEKLGRRVVALEDAVAGLKDDLENVVKEFDDKLTLKADTTYVDDKLALMAETKNVDDKLALKADTKSVDDKLALKADTTYVADKFAELQRQIQKGAHPAPALRHRGYSVGFEDQVNSEAEIPNRAEASVPTNATNCIAMKIDGNVIYLGILPEFSMSRVAIIYPNTQSHVHVLGPVHSPRISSTLCPDIVITDWAVENIAGMNKLTAKIVVDLQGLLESLPAASGELPRKAYWGIGSVHPNLQEALKQKTIFESSKKLADTVVEYDPGCLGMGSVAWVDCKQKKIKGLKALLVGPARPAN